MCERAKGVIHSSGNGLVTFLAIMWMNNDLLSIASPETIFSEISNLHHQVFLQKSEAPLVQQQHVGLPHTGCEIPLQWRHNGRNSISNHQPHDCLLNRLFRRRSKKTSKLRVTGLCAGNSPGTGEFPTQMASYAEIFSIWWHHHACSKLSLWLYCELFASLAFAFYWTHSFREMKNIQPMADLVTI